MDGWSGTSPYGVVATAVVGTMAAGHPMTYPYIYIYIFDNNRTQLE